MNALHGQRLDDRGVISVSGAAAHPFLQNLITNDVDRLPGEPALFAGLLSPQGKVLFEFIVSALPAGYALDVAASQTAELAKRLTLYKLRAKVVIEDVSARHGVFVGARQSSGPSDPRFADLGQRLVMPVEAGRTESAAGPTEYDARRIALGVPEGGKDYAFGTVFPHEAMFDQLNGVSFTKGCYVGQEIVSRMQHRGTARSRFLMVTGEGPLPAMGTEVLAGTAPLGNMGSSAGTRGLALIRLDRLADAYAAGQPVTAGGVALTLAKPPYANFEVPTA